MCDSTSTLIGKGQRLCRMKRDDLCLHYCNVQDKPEDCLYYDFSVGNLCSLPRTGMYMHSTNDLDSCWRAVCVRTHVPYRTDDLVCVSVPHAAARWWKGSTSACGRSTQMIFPVTLYLDCLRPCWCRCEQGLRLCELRLF